MKEENRAPVEQIMPDKYVKPMIDVISRFTETVLSPAACSPILVAVVIAVVIVVSEAPRELVLTDKEKAALKYAVEQIRANPEMARQIIGAQLTRAHLELMETLAQ